MGKLTDTAIRKARPGPKTVYLNDGDGLRLEVRPDDKRYWRFRYTHQGKPKLSGLGRYPDLTLAAAREKAAQLRQDVANGVDPILERKRQSTVGTTVREIGDQWYAVQLRRWSPGHAKRMRAKLTGDVYPELGSLHIADVTPPDVLRVANRFVRRGAIKSASEATSIVGGICRYAIGLGLRVDDPTVHLRGVVQRPIKPQRHPALLKAEDVGAFLKDLDQAANRSVVVRGALWAVIFTWQRVGTVLSMRWDDLDRDQWLVRPEVNKTGVEMLVPLPAQLTARLQDLPRFDEHVFSLGNGPISTQAPQKLVRALGWHGRASVHGFRATGRTVASEVLGYPPEVCEAQLLHITDKHRGAYARAIYLDQRREMIQRYADLMMEWRDGAV